METTQKTKLNKAVEVYKAATTDDEKLKAGTVIVELLAPEFEDEAKLAVKMLEGDTMETTRGNYAKYGALLGEVKGFYRLALIKALRDAGAGRGLDDALRVF